jgi:hypothetical protein
MRFGISAWQRPANSSAEQQAAWVNFTRHGFHQSAVSWGYAHEQARWVATNDGRGNSRQLFERAHLDACHNFANLPLEYTEG